MAEKDEGIRIRRYTELLMPLLFETWMEVRPASLNNANRQHLSDDDVHISNEAAFTLKTILEIMEKLYELMAFWDDEVNNQELTDWFRNTYNKEFSTQFLLGYPFLQSDGYKGNITKILVKFDKNQNKSQFTQIIPTITFSGSKRKSKGVPTEQEVHEAGGTKCFLQNLNIAYVFCCLNNSNASKVNIELAEKIIKFLKGKYYPKFSSAVEKKNVLLNEWKKNIFSQGNIQQLEHQNQEVSFALVKVLRAIFIVNGENWIKSNIDVKDLLKLVMGVYQRGKFSKDIRTKVLILLCDIVLNFKLYELYGWVLLC